MQSPPSVRPSVSTLTFKPSDLSPGPFVSVWIKTVALLGLKKSKSKVEMRWVGPPSEGNSSFDAVHNFTASSVCELAFFCHTGIYLLTASMSSILKESTSCAVCMLFSSHNICLKASFMYLCFVHCILTTEEYYHTVTSWQLICLCCDINSINGSG